MGTDRIDPFPGQGMRAHVWILAGGQQGLLIAKLVEK